MLIKRVYPKLISRYGSLLESEEEAAASTSDKSKPKERDETPPAKIAFLYDTDVEEAVIQEGGNPESVLEPGAGVWQQLARGSRSLEQFALECCAASDIAVVYGRRAITLASAGKEYAELAGSRTRWIVGDALSTDTEVDQFDAVASFASGIVIRAAATMGGDDELDAERMRRFLAWHGTRFMGRESWTAVPAVCVLARPAILELLPKRSADYAITDGLQEIACAAQTLAYRAVERRSFNSSLATVALTNLWYARWIRDPRTGTDSATIRRVLEERRVFPWDSSRELKEPPQS